MQSIPSQVKKGMSAGDVLGCFQRDREYLSVCVQRLRGFELSTAYLIRTSPSMSQPMICELGGKASNESDIVLMLWGGGGKLG